MSKRQQGKKKQYSRTKLSALKELEDMGRARKIMVVVMYGIYCLHLNGDMSMGNVQVTDKLIMFAKLLERQKFMPTEGEATAALAHLMRNHGVRDLRVMDVQEGNEIQH